MNILKLMPAAALFMGLSFASFAGNDNGAKDAKPEAKVEASAKTTTNQEMTYYAIRIENTNNFRWTSDISETENLECLTLPGASCSVTADGQPANGENPDPSPNNRAWQQPE